MDQLVRDTLHEQAAEATATPSGFAGRVLAVRRRRRNRALAGAAAVTAVAVAVAVGVPVLYDGKDEPRLASQMNRSDIVAHPDQSPPRDLIAAGDTALAAYFTRDAVEETGGQVVDRRAYHLLDQRTGKYVKAPEWSFVAVAPGMRTAAVLEEELPTRRIGLLDLRTGEVERWITVDHPVAGIEFSPDGDRLLATTYSENPDKLELAPNDSDHDGKRNDWFVQYGKWFRTGFYVLDVDSGDGAWREVAGREGKEFAFAAPRRDFAFSHDGELVRSALSWDSRMQYYDLEGDKTAVPEDEKYLKQSSGAGLSPNGRLVVGDSAAGGAFEEKSKDGSPDQGTVKDAVPLGKVPTGLPAGGDEPSGIEINEPSTGERLHTVPGQSPLVWADDKRLISWDIEPGTNEFHNRLVLVTVGSDKTVPLSGFRQGNDGAPGRWVPVFARR
ncbi:WD40 repeat domain-containing protein [Streptomyces sp. NPDC006285]|uniref:WD40 repeat domain-containing protein n=1 Tax=Streptomyces sp. NPDC006285 TaxID=3364742 RepID=UPI0036CCF230